MSIYLCLKLLTTERDGRYVDFTTFIGRLFGRKLLGPVFTVWFLLDIIPFAGFGKAGIVLGYYIMR